MFILVTINWLKGISMPKVDKTHLSINLAEQRGLIHRDYIAHCFRWSHVAKWIQNKYKNCNVLDIGCGKEFPFARTLYSNRFLVKQYVGVDPNKTLSDFNLGKMNANLYSETYFPNDFEISDEVYKINKDDACLYSRPDLITSFEVLEHVEPSMTREMLEGIHKIAHDDTVIFISTPCYDAKTGAAGNHPNEITRDALGALIEDLGFQIDGNWGTFASIKDYSFMMNKHEKMIFDRLREYYDTNVLATIFAPLFPMGSRNNLWQLSKVKKGYKRNFDPLDNITGPWTSNDNWDDLAGEL